MSRCWDYYTYKATTPAEIVFIGLGRMGLPMARILAKAGHQVRLRPQRGGARGGGSGRHSGRRRSRERALDYLAGLPAAPLVVRAAKDVVRASRPARVSDASSKAFERLWFTEDHREAERAFVEKRKPIFVGR